MTNFCRNLAGTFSNDGSSLTWTISPGADPVPTLSGGVLDTDYELNKLQVFSANGSLASAHSFDTEFGDGELLMSFIKTSFNGDYDAAVEDQYGVATVAILFNEGENSTGDWFEPFGASAGEGDASLTMADIISGLGDSSTTKLDFPYFMYTGGETCNADNEIVNQFYFVAENTLSINSTQLFDIPAGGAPLGSAGNCRKIMVSYPLPAEMGEC